MAVLSLSFALPVRSTRSCKSQWVQQYLLNPIFKAVIGQLCVMPHLDASSTEGCVSVPASVEDVGNRLRQQRPDPASTGKRSSSDQQCLVRMEAETPCYSTHYQASADQASHGHAKTSRLRLVEVPSAGRNAGWER